jgi:hypothetical protein
VKFTTILVTGYSKAPKDTALYETYTYMGVSLEINVETNEIVNADFTFITGLPQDFLRRLIVGYNLKNGINPLVGRIRNCFFARSQQSVIVAIQSAVQRYWDSKK